jgi:hypothetical protein
MDIKLILENQLVLLYVALQQPNLEDETRTWIRKQISLTEKRVITWDEDLYGKDFYEKMAR